MDCIFHVSVLSEELNVHRPLCSRRRDHRGSNLFDLPGKARQIKRKEQEIENSAVSASRTGVASGRLQGASG